jgi:hypothetical protein
MAQAGPWANYSSYAPITVSSTTPVNCRAIFVPAQSAAGTVVVASKVGGTLVTFTIGIAASTDGLPFILPVELNQGIVDASSTITTGLVALQ